MHPLTLLLSVVTFGGLAIAQPVEPRDELHWAVTLYQKGCPRDNDPFDPGLQKLGSVAGAAGQDLFCYRLSGGHSAYLKNIKAAGMKVVAYSNWGCTNEIETWKEDGCVVVNAEKHTTIEAISIMRV